MSQPLSMVPRPLKLTAGWYVLVTWEGGHEERVTPFLSEAEAQLWIEKSSAKWLATRQPKL
jgi:hypothetical protein